MRDAVDRFRAETGVEQAIRLGIDSGPVVARVVGHRKFSYDVSGDTRGARQIERDMDPGEVVGEKLARVGGRLMHLRQRLPRRSSVVVAFIALVVLAGGNGVAIRVVNRDLDPLWGATLRFASAALVFAALVAMLRVPVPSRRARVGASLYGLLFFAVGFGLVHWSLADVGAGLAQTLLAATPLFTIVLAWAQRLEVLRWRVAAGAVLALGGVVLIFSRAVPADVPAASVLAVVAAAICWAQAGIVVKRYPPTHPTWMNTIAMAIGAAGAFTAATVRGEDLQGPGGTDTWAALAYLVVPGSLGVFGLYIYVLRHWDASVASFQLVLIPIVAAPVAAWIDDEAITSIFVAGAALVLAGTYIALRASGPAPTPPGDTDHSSAPHQHR